MAEHGWSKRWMPSCIFGLTFKGLFPALTMCRREMLRSVSPFSSCTRRSFALSFQSPVHHIGQSIFFSKMAQAQADQPAPETPAPWHAAYPAPSNPKPDAVTREEVLNMMKSGEVAGRGFILVDLRRTDHEAGLRHLFLPPLSKPLDFFFDFFFFACEQSVVQARSCGKSLTFASSRAVRFAGPSIFRPRAYTRHFPPFIACSDRPACTR